MKLYQGNGCCLSGLCRTIGGLSGFKGGFSAPCTLRLDGSIVFRESGMRDAFLEACARQNQNAFLMRVTGTRLGFIWQ
jgi:hypothetical protein